MVLSLSAKGLSITHGEIFAYRQEVYATSVSEERVTRIADRVTETMSVWLNRPLNCGRLLGGDHRRHPRRDPRRAGDQYFRTTPRFETGDTRYAWLNQSVSVAEGRLLPGFGVEYRVYCVA